MRTTFFRSCTFLALAISLWSCHNRKYIGQYSGDHSVYFHPMNEDENTSMDIKTRMVELPDGTSVIKTDTIYMCVDPLPGLLIDQTNQTIDLYYSRGLKADVSFSTLYHYELRKHFYGIAKIEEDTLSLTLTKNTSDLVSDYPIKVRYIISPESNRRFNRKFSLMYYPQEDGNYLIHDSLWHDQYWLKNVNDE